MQKSEIENLFYIQKNYSKIKELLKNSHESWSFNMLGKISLTENNIIEAFNYFNNAGNIQACGYCKFLTGNTEEAEIILSLIKDSSPFVNWLLYLISILKGNKYKYPTYFQIRNFYEQDLDMLIKLKQYGIAEKILEHNSSFERFNKEIYKYSARVLLNNKKINAALLYLKKSIDICYNDPETHYILGELYLMQNNKILAEQEFKKSNEVNSGYLPAIKRLKDLCN